MISQFRSCVNWLLQQFQLKPGKPAIGSALQVLFSALGPLLVGVAVGQPTQSAIGIMGAWMVSMVNVEGVYRQQATAKIAAVLSITAMLLLANLVQGSFWLSILTTFLVFFVLGFIGLWGAAASAISLTTSIMFIVAMARFATFPNWVTILQQCLICLGGGLWSIAIALFVWQLHPYQPVTQSIANCYRSLSQLIEAAKGRVAHPEDRRAQFSQFLKAQDDFTQALTTARDRWSTAWTDDARNEMGSQLLILVEDASAIASLAATLVEQVVIVSDQPLFQAVQREIEQSLGAITAASNQITKAIVKGTSSVSLGDLDRTLEALNHQLQTLQTQLKIDAPQQDHTVLDKIFTTLTRIADQLYVEADLIANLKREERHSGIHLTYPGISLPTRSQLAAILDPLRDNLTVHSIFFRHALRLAMVATIAEVLAAQFQIPRGYWITLTAVVALKPNYGGTSQTTLQRTLGTVVGGVIGIAIVALIHNPWVTGVCLLVLIMTAMAIRPLSIILFITLLTPAIILLLNVTNQGGWQVGVQRIADSFLGGVLAVLGSYLLFPRWERQQLPSQLETTLRSNLAYFHQVIEAYVHPSQTEAILPSSHQAALENSNLAASAQRLFSEPRNVQGDVETITTLVFYIRRFFNSVTALADHRQEFSGKYDCPAFKQFATTIAQVLENAADALEQRQVPQPLPEALDRYLEGIHSHITQLESAPIQVAAGSSTTRISRAVREQTPVSMGLEQICYETKNIHARIAKLMRSRKLSP